VGLGEGNGSGGKTGSLRPYEKFPAHEGKILNLNGILANEGQVSDNDDRRPTMIGTDALEPELANRV
jgi:hypothetical protein